MRRILLRAWQLTARLIVSPRALKVPEENGEEWTKERQREELETLRLMLLRLEAEIVAHD